MTELVRLWNLLLRRRWLQRNGSQRR